MEKYNQLSMFNLPAVELMRLGFDNFSRAKKYFEKAIGVYENEGQSENAENVRSAAMLMNDAYEKIADIKTEDIDNG